MKTKLIQKIKEEFYERDAHDPSFNTIDGVWNFIEKAISQSKEEEREKTLMELYRSGEIQTKDGVIFDPRQVVGRLVRLIAGLEKLSNK